MNKSVALAAYSTLDPVIAQWHERLAHLGEQSIKKFEHMVEGLDLIKFPEEACLCENYIKAKMKSLPYRGKITPGQFAMDLIHSDIGSFPRKYNAIKGYRYYVLFKDDFTKFFTVYLMHHKGDVFAKFKKFKAHFEVGGRRIHRIRNNNGPEYNSRMFAKFREDNGILWEPSVPDNQQQNGVAKRIQGTINEWVYALIFSSGIGKEWWPEIL